jgi:lysophospholipase L1-like esterase
MPREPHGAVRNIVRASKSGKVLGGARNRYVFMSNARRIVSSAALCSLGLILSCSGSQSSEGDSGGTSSGGAAMSSAGGTPNGGASAGGAQGGSNTGTAGSGGALAQGGAGTASGGKNSAGAGSAGAFGGGSPAGGAFGGGSPAGGAANGGAANGGTANGGAANGGAANGTGGGAGASSACASNQRAVCTGTNPISCHFGGNPGNYEVSVVLGGAAAGDTYVEVESFRRMLGSTTTAAGQTKSFTFVANVRQPEGQPVQNGSNDGTPGLDVYVRGTNPKLDSICFRAAPKPKMVWIAGDSTVCDQSDTDYAGWAQHLPQFFDAPVSIANYADSGESSGSFLNSSAMFGAIKSRWQAGDWFFVQMGHNDKTTSAATFQANMTSYVTQAKAAGLNVVLVTPISRVGYTLAEEHVNSAGANLPQIIRDLGKSQNVPVIDLTVTTWNWLQTIRWQDYFALGTDHTHTNPKGAAAVAGFVRDAIKTQNLALATYLRP